MKTMKLRILRFQVIGGKCQTDRNICQLLGLKGGFLFIVFLSCESHHLEIFGFFLITPSTPLADNSGAVLETINDTAETRRLTRCLWSSLDPGWYNKSQRKIKFYHLPAKISFFTDMLIDDVSLGPFEEVKRWYSPRAYSIANRVVGLLMDDYLL